MSHRSAPAAALPGVPLSDVLRARTADLHARVEAAMPVMDPALTLADYARLLGRLVPFYDGAERALGEWATELRALGVDLDERRKLPRLEADVRALAERGAGATAAAAPDRPPAVLRPLATTLPRALGTLYVLEGATLGGQLIARRLRAELAVDAESGGAFFASYGARVGPLWKAMRAALDGWGSGQASAAEREEAIGGARDTFLAFGYAVAAARGAERTTAWSAA